MFPISPLRIDPTTLPPPLCTSEIGSFAYNTLKIRVPRILRETIEDNAFSSEINHALEELYGEITHGRIRELRAATPDRDFWNGISCNYIGRSWLDVPWYWAEAYFYRRVLEATRFFENDVDPYAYKKAQEWETNAAPRSLNDVLSHLPDEPRARFESLLHASLWSNRADLSYHVAKDFGHHSESNDDLLIDDSARVWDVIRTNRIRRLVLIADNTGTELALDLAFIDFLLGAGDHQGRPYVERVDLHLKAQTFFVSDTMPRDVEIGLCALERGQAGARGLALRLRKHLADARLQLHTHWFYTSCLHYFQLPDDLFADLRTSDFVILKGDANHRRLLGDAHWQPTASFGDATRYFPAPFVSLRTLKAELITGLRAGLAAQLDAIDPTWRVNGKRGIVQGNFKPEL